MTSFLSENVLVPLKCEGLCREGALGWVGGRNSVPVVLCHRPAGTAMAAGNPSPATALGKAAPVWRRACSGQRCVSRQRELRLFPKRTRKRSLRPSWRGPAVVRDADLPWGDTPRPPCHSRGSYLHTTAKSNVFWKIQVIMEVV